MRTVFARLAGAVAAVGLLASDAAAWSYKEHIQFTRLAAARIVADPAAPAALKAWITSNTPLLPSLDAERDFFLNAAVGINPDPSKLSGLTWWVCVPDLEATDRSNKTSEPAGKPERLNHFIDLELFNTVPQKRTYQLDLSSLPKITDIPRALKNETFVRAGYLPLARQHAYDKLVAAIKAGRLAPDPANPDDHDHAVKWAGYLAHYTQDNTQPHHATMDYKSAQYFKGIKNSPNVHAEMEYRMADEPTQPLPELRETFWKAFAKQLETVQDPVQTKDIFTSTLEVSMASYRYLPLIGEAAKAAMIQDKEGKPAVDTEKFFHFSGSVDGKPLSVLEMKAHQTAWAVARAEAVLKQAWAEAHAQ